MGSEPAVFTPEEEALLERVAARVVELRLEVAAVLALESVRPLSFVAGQAMVFFQPLVQALLRFDDYRRFAGLLEHRESLDRLVSLIERRAEARGAPPAGGAAPPPRRPS